MAVILTNCSQVDKKIDKIWWDPVKVCLGNLRNNKIMYIKTPTEYLDQFTDGKKEQPSVMLRSL